MDEMLYHIKFLPVRNSNGNKKIQKSFLIVEKNWFEIFAFSIEESERVKIVM